MKDFIRELIESLRERTKEMSPEQKLAHYEFTLDLIYSKVQKDIRGPRKKKEGTTDDVVSEDATGAELPS